MGRIEKNRLSIKIKCIIMAILMLLTVFVRKGEEIYASHYSEDLNYNNNNEFLKSKKYEYTRKKINDELDNKTKKVNDEVEFYLNNQGVFDKEIINMDETSLEYLKDIDINQIQISNTFYKLDQTLQDGEIINEELTELKDEDINNIIADVYYDIKTDEKDSITDDFLEVFGLKPIEIYANGSETYESHTDYLKKLLVIFPVTINGQKYYRITLQCTWLTMPKVRSLDVVSFRWSDQLIYDPSSDGADETIAKFKCTYTATTINSVTEEVLSKKTNSYTYPFSKSSFEHHLDGVNVDLSAFNCATFDHGMVATFRLREDTITDNPDEATACIKTVTEMSTIMSINLLKEPTASNTLSFEAIYSHVNKKWNIDISKIRLKGPTPNAVINGIYLILKNLSAISYDEYTTECGHKLEDVYYFE